MRTSVRILLLLYAVAIAAIAAVCVLALGIPALPVGVAAPRGLIVMATSTGIVVLIATVLLLFRGIARPIDRLLAAARRLGSGHGTAGSELPILGEDGELRGAALGRAAVAFERVATALDAERASLAAKVDELTEANRALAEARDSLVRSEKLATIGRLAAGVAHEVGNPLGAIRGYVDLAHARLPERSHPDLVDALDRIGSAAERIDRIIRDLLDLARPARPVLGPVDLKDVLDASVRLARMQARFRDVDVHIELAPGAASVVADAHQLSQVLLNLLLNSGDAMRGRGRVWLRARAPNPGQVVVDVEDDGPGVPEGDLPRIFDPFFTTKDPGAGTGLGLAISLRIMQSFGGDITVANRPGGGAVFELTFGAVRRHDAKLG